MEWGGDPLLSISPGFPSKVPAIDCVKSGAEVSLIQEGRVLYCFLWSSWLESLTADELGKPVSKA